MWIVRLALRRPYTIAVMCVLFLLMGALSMRRMQVDIFPSIDIPVVTVVWSYNGLTPEEMERRVVNVTERAMSTTVNGIERIESQSIQGVAILRVYFQPGTDIGGAIAQIGSVTNTILRILPPGMTPPNIIQFNASNVPVVQMTARSETLSEQQIYDYSLNFIRIRLFTIPGLSTPAPFGGRGRQISVDIDPAKLAARGLSPADVVTGLSSENVIVPAGTARLGSREMPILTNSNPSKVDDLKAIPLKLVNGSPVYLRDVAQVYDGFTDQTNIVRINGNRATYLAILKKADASTLAVVDSAREMLPTIKAAAPKGLELNFDFDQSQFVRGAISDVVKEGFVASLLVSLMILFFLGSWRSMLLVCTSIPLAIFAGIIGLKLSGQTMNIMTLGGLSLAIGMLVDDATVEVENIHRNQAMGKPLTVAILDGAGQIAVPAIVATLAICIVFFPVVLLVGPAKYLFTPLAMAVVYSMLASYLLSRTLVPTLARMLLEHDHHAPESRLGRFNAWRERGFARFQDAYGRLLDRVLHHRVFVLGLAVVFATLSLALLGVLGRDFFPAVDVGLMKLHVRTPSGLRLEETERVVAQVEGAIRELVPARDLATINSNIGVPSSFNMAFIPSDNVTSQDADVSISLKHEHRPTAGYMKALREELPRRFPGVGFYFQSADIVSQVLNFGIPAAIDVQIEGPNLAASAEVARRLEAGMRRVPGAVDVRLKQVVNAPGYRVEVNRVRAAQLGLNQQAVANGLMVSLSGNGQLAPSYYLDPVTGVNYTVAVKTPLARLSSPRDLMATPFSLPGGGALLQTTAFQSAGPGAQALSEPLSNFATLNRINVPSEINHYTVQRVLDVMAGVEGRDLGAVVADIQAQLRNLGPLPPNTRIRIRGQFEVMVEAFVNLAGGLLIAIALVYLLMAVLYQSWLDPFIILFAVPGALVGILWMLALTGTTLNVESMMGAIMAVGIATSNSILLVSFANDVRVAHPEMTALEAAFAAGRTRLRPVLMTALAMILGMIPMALALGEAGSQNAPLGRAVIGGLLMATVVTLFIVPVVYSLFRKKPPTAHLLDETFHIEQQGSES
ncbi:efflux RND transporter permease subunit [Mesoterricola silvestris]|uniref:RND transporter n=1 Tax=Mesoterricola silvestris TaxID=2927979 RepID=A0AA48GP12_9BACT|nr:efflux RND transporter permease subunit [Mesoterricola silvestris]BDU73454.1 RND transporter [Mesoterricola silvestris]